MIRLRSGRAQIIASFSALIVQLCIVACVAIYAGRQVRDSFARHVEAGAAAWLIVTAVERASQLEIAVNRFARTEMAHDKLATDAALSALRAALLATGTAREGPIAEAAQKVAAYPALLAEMSRAIIARRDAAGAVADAATSIATAATAMHDRAAAMGLDEAASTVFRMQNAAQRSSMFAVRYQSSASRSDLSAAEAELVRLSSSMDDLEALLAGVPRMAHQLGAAQSSVAQLATSIASLQTEMRHRDAAIDEMARDVGRIVAMLEAARIGLSEAQASAEHELQSTLTRSERAEVGASVVTVLLGLACVVVLLRTCVLPMSGLVAATRRLATGDLSTSVPHAGRTDEIGELSRALVTLRDGSVRAQVLEADAARVLGLSSGERHRLAAANADATERALGGVARTIGTTSDRLLRSAESLNGIAVRTSGRAGTVVVGSQQSRTIAESVASAADRLADSVSAIVKKVEEAAGVAAGAAGGPRARCCRCRWRRMGFSRRRT